MTKSYCFFICIQICDEFHNIVLVQLSMSGTELESQNVSLTDLLVLGISSTYFAMWFDMVLVFVVLRGMWAKYTELCRLTEKGTLQ